MNERILELMRQADYPAPEMAPRAQKLAELIVRMCADYADMVQDAGCEYAGDYVAEAMGYGQEEGVTEWRAK